MITVLHALFAAILSVQAADDASGPAPAQDPVRDGVRVVELFTSQGCPMCPGANALIAEIGAAEGDVLALSYGVDYWDEVYGWEDTFAMEAFTARQQAYVDAGDAHRVFTPHFVINGGPEKLRYSEERVRGAVEAAASLPILLEAATSPEGRITLTLEGAARDSAAQVWFVTYHPGVATRLIESGPNAGREMTHYNMVRDIQALGEWRGRLMSLEAPAPADGLAAAVLVQDGPGGRILTAARAN